MGELKGAGGPTISDWHTDGSSPLLSTPLHNPLEVAGALAARRESYGLGECEGGPGSTIEHQGGGGISGRQQRDTKGMIKVNVTLMRKSMNSQYKCDSLPLCSD